MHAARSAAALLAGYTTQLPYAHDFTAAAAEVGGWKAMQGEGVGCISSDPYSTHCIYCYVSSVPCFIHMYALAWKATTLPHPRQHDGTLLSAPVPT
jgi:hypothetical protein